MNASTILMVRPVCFDYNIQTASTNTFQHTSITVEKESIQNAALKEFDSMVELLTNAGIGIISVEDTTTPSTPDSIFPNNWISFHQDGTVVLYPMMAENRRLERRSDIIELVKNRFSVKQVIDLSVHEKSTMFLEGTGSLVLDYENNYAYACLSPRTNKELTELFCSRLGYVPVFFSAKDEQGQAIYHTNVMMCVGEHFCVICLDSIRDRNERAFVEKTLSRSGKELIAISYEQMNHFSGNMYEVINNKGEHLLIMSEQAHSSLIEEQIKALEKHCRLLPIPLYTIEKYGGGSARCMMADIRLKKE